MTRTVGVAVFRKTCARLIAQVTEQREPITITKHGRPVALLAPVPRPRRRPSADHRRATGIRVGLR